jgi:hypothetical protein
MLGYLESQPEGVGRSQEIVDATIAKMKEIIIDTLMSVRV